MNWIDGTRSRITASVAAILLLFSNPFTKLRAQNDKPSAIAIPQFAVDPFWPRQLPNEWITGEVGGICVDAQDHVFTVNRDDLSPKEEKINRPAPPVIEYSAEGAVVNSWGDPQVLPDRIHGCFVDNENNVWVAGQYDAIVQKYSHDGELLLQIGKKGVYDSSDGTRDGAAMNSSHSLLNQPASMAVDPSNGDVYIADGYGNRRIVVFDKNGRYLRQWGRQGTVVEGEDGVPGAFAQWVHCVVVGNDGLLYVCDRRADRVQVFDKMGQFKRNIYIQKGTGKLGRADGSVWWIAFSPDKAQTYMYVADGGNEKIWIVERASGKILTGFGAAGHQAGQFSYLHSIAVDSQGNILTAETIGGRRIQKFKPVVATKSN
jgi:DNA-binding beta-propeller fold protein YncE